MKLRVSLSLFVAAGCGDNSNPGPSDTIGEGTATGTTAMTSATSVGPATSASSSGTSGSSGVDSGSSSDATGTTTGAMPDAPPWVGDLTPGVWEEVSTNTLADVDPADDPAINPNFPNSPPWRGNSGQGSVTGAWNGGAFVPTAGEAGALIAWGGGHQDYFGNEIYAFDMASQTWDRITDPYAEELSWPYTDGIYPDGTPAPPHTYDFIEFHPPTNSLVVLRTMASPNPNNVPVAAMFSFDEMQWRRSPANTESHHNSGGFSAYDPVRELLWVEGGTGTNALAAFDAEIDNGDGTFGGWTSYADKLGGTLDEMGAYDPVRDIIVATRFRAGEDMFGIDPADPEADAVLLTMADAPARGGAHGWEWSDRREAFIYWNSGASVYEVALDGADWRTDAWAWTDITSPENALAPEGTRIYSKFRVATYADAEVAVALVDTELPVYAFRIPD